MLPEKKWIVHLFYGAAGAAFLILLVMVLTDVPREPAAAIPAGALWEESSPALSSSVSSAAPSPSSQLPSVSSPEQTEGKIDINRAGSGELQRLDGIGPVLSERIIAYREEHGPFRSVEELLEVKGIGEKRLAAIREDIYLSSAE